MSISQPDQQRLDALNRLGLLESISFPVFDEVTQMVSRFLDLPICILSVFDADTEYFQAAIGLSRLGLMNPLAASRQLPRHQSLSTQVLDRQQVCRIDAMPSESALSQSLLVERYGIQAYLGVPLFDANGICLGALAVMDQHPHTFSTRDIEFLELEARWCIGEIERHWLVQRLHAAAPATLHKSITVADLARAALPIPTTPVRPTAIAAAPPVSTAQLARIELITQLTQELRTPLTSIMGMTSVLSRKIYGGLTEKQEEYLSVMRESGQCLLSLVDEITELGQLDSQDMTLEVVPADIEMVCQQAIKSLNQVAQRHHQSLQLTLEPGPRIWLLDKDKVRQMLYHLAFTVIQCACDESTIRLHISRKQNMLNIAVWVSNPWLSGNFSSLEINPDLATISTHLTQNAEPTHPDMLGESQPIAADKAGAKERRDRLAIMLSQQLAKLHGGDILVQGSAEKGVRYVIMLPAEPGVDDARSPSASSSTAHSA